jgi:hypothetical protein
MNNVRSRFTALLGVVAIIGLVGVGIYGLWHLGWDVTAANTDRQAQVNQSSLGAQQSYSDALGRYISTVRTIDTQLADPSISTDQKTALAGQKNAISDEACRDAEKLTHPTGDQSAWIGQNCDAGSVTGGN